MRAGGRFSEGTGAGARRECICASWERSAQAGLDSRHAVFHRVSDDELRRRLQSNAHLIDTAHPQLDGLSATFSDHRHVACVTDADGIILYATGDPLLCRELGMSPGNDWSESRMGTAGVGLSMAEGRPVEVVGADHYLEFLHAYICTAAPVRDDEGRVIGALNITGGMNDGETTPISLVSHIAFVIERELAYRHTIEAHEPDQAVAVQSQMEEAHRRDVNAHLRDMVDHTTAFVWSVDLQNRYLHVNRQWQRVFGHSLEEIRGKRMDEVFAADQVARLCANNAKVIAERVPHQFEEMLFAEGRLRTYLTVKVPIFDAAGEPCGVCGIATEITGRKDAERRMRRHAEQLQGLADVAGTVLAAQGVRAVLQAVTEAARTLIGAHQAAAGLAPEAGRMQGIQALSMSDKYAAWHKFDAKPTGEGIYRLVCERNLPMRMTQAQLQAHPAWRHFSHVEAEHPPLRGWLAAPMMRRDGTSLGLIQLSDKYDSGDFTEDDQAILTQLARMASIAIENATLYETLSERNRRKDQFLAMLAHELRNPLAPIRNAVSIMKLADLQDEKLRWVRDVVDRQLRQLTRLVDDLLDAARISSGQVKLRRARIEVDEFLREAIEVAQLMTARKRQALIVRRPSEPVYVDADAARMSQVVANLLSNASRFTGEGGTIWLTCEATAEHLSIAVRDNGPGIEESLLGSIFEIFVRSGDPMADEGLGIGLWLAKGFVDEHGGTLEAHSEGRGKGAEFIMRLPRVPAPTSGSARVPERSDNATGPAADRPA
jgi:PAS domain S-box-containing protein